MDAEKSEVTDRCVQAMPKGIERSDLADELLALAAQLRSLDCRRLDPAEGQALDALLKTVLDCVEKAPRAVPARRSSR